MAVSPPALYLSSRKSIPRSTGRRQDAVVAHYPASAARVELADRLMMAFRALRQPCLLRHPERSLDQLRELRLERVGGAAALEDVPPAADLFDPAESEGGVDFLSALFPRMIRPVVWGGGGVNLCASDTRKTLQRTCLGFFQGLQPGHPQSQLQTPLSLKGEQDRTLHRSTTVLALGLEVSAPVRYNWLHAVTPVRQEASRRESVNGR